MKTGGESEEQKYCELAWMEVSGWESHLRQDIAMASVRFQWKTEALNFGLLLLLWQ